MECGRAVLRPSSGCNGAPSKSLYRKPRKESCYRMLLVNVIRHMNSMESGHLIGGDVRFRDCKRAKPICAVAGTRWQELCTSKTWRKDGVGRSPPSPKGISRREVPKRIRSSRLQQRSPKLSGFCGEGPAPAPLPMGLTWWASQRENAGPGGASLQARPSEGAASSGGGQGFPS